MDLMFVFKLGVFSLLLVEASAQFPRACATLEAYLSKECCPTYRGSQCGELLGRGICADIKIDEEPWGGPYTLIGIDDRERWPERFFNRSCECLGNFGGFDCSSCKFGWTGEDCAERRPLAVRKNIREMPEKEATRFLEALDQAKFTPHPDFVVARDHYSVRDTLLGPGQAFTGIDFSHEGPAFLTWHRMHLLNLEYDLQRMTGDRSLAIPYWNFAIGGDQCDICSDDLLGGRHPTNPERLSPLSRFADWEIVCLSLDWFDDNIKLCNGTYEGPIIRNPGGNVDRPAVQKLPEPKDVAECLSVPSYDTFPLFSNSDGSFRNTLEGYSDVDGEFIEGARTLHNLAHLFLNGTGGQTHASANDPIFVLLHSFTDAIFEAWLEREISTLSEYPVRNAPIGHNLDYNMVPFFPPVRNRDMFVSSVELGYTYEVELPEIDDAITQFILVIVGVASVFVLVALVILAWSAIRRYREKMEQERLYEKIISEREDGTYNYTA